MNKAEIVAGLRSMGLVNGDKVLLHSSLISLGKVDGGPEAVIYCPYDMILSGNVTEILPLMIEEIKARKA